MKKLFVHIGHQKCGSTTIQVWFNKHQEALKEYKVHYLKSGRFDATHNQLALKLLPGNSNPLSKNQSQELKEEIENSSAEYFLISGENFVGPRFLDVSIASLRELLPENLEVHIVLIVRRQYDWIPSFWAQIAKLGTDFRGYDEWYAQCFPKKIASINYHWLCNLWSESCQPTGIRVLSFEDMVASSDGLLGAFLKELELPLPPDEILQDCALTNISPTYETILFCQSFFASLRDRDPSLWQVLKGNNLARSAISTKLKDFMTYKELGGGAKKWTTLERKQEIFEYYKDSNYDVIQQFSTLENFKRFLAPPTEDTININYDQITSQSSLLPEATFFIMSNLIRERYLEPRQNKS